jgi:ribosomal protein L11 methyltransferase
MNDEWVEISVFTDEGGADIASALLMVIGCDGTSEEVDEATGGVVVRGWLPSHENVVELIDWVYERMEVALKCGLTKRQAKIETHIVEQCDWLREWQGELKPLTIGRSFLIIPMGLKERFGSELNEGRIVIALSAVGGFGTGHHPTTKMCLELMEEIKGEFIGADVLDVGCGSGILSIAAAKLGARSVLAVDIEESAIKCTMQNAIANGVGEKVRTILSNLADSVYGRFHIIVSNLITDLVQRLAVQISAKGLLSDERTAYWIASGIPTQKFEEHTWGRELSKLGLQIARVSKENFWVAFLAVKEAR